MRYSSNDDYFKALDYTLPKHIVIVIWNIPNFSNTYYTSQ